MDERSIAKLEHMKEVFAEHWGELSELTFTEIARKYLGDEESFFTCAESMDAISRSDEDDEAAAKRIMSLLAALVKTAFDHGKEMATQ
jgi:hypothetical protein